MGFLAPWFLAGLAAVGLPIWIHMLRRHRSVPKPFASLMFFERRTQSSIKHRRLEHLLLLALRVALLVLLAIAFAGPYFTSTRQIGGGGKKLVVLAIDESFSMRQAGALDAARQQALSTLSSVRQGDQFQVLAFASGVRILTQPEASVDEARAAIRAVEAGDSRSSYAELARGLRSISQAARVPLEVHVFSDLQRSSMPSAFADLQLASDARLVLHPVSEDRAGNWAVESVSAPRRVFGESGKQVRATLAGYGTSDASRTASLVVNGKTLDTKTVTVPASGRAAVEFQGVKFPHGWNRAQVRVDNKDPLEGDNIFHFAVERAEPRKILFVHQGRDRRGELYFRAAVESTPDAAFQVTAITDDHTGGIVPGEFSLVVLSDAGAMAPAFVESLRQYVRNGGSVWVALGPASSIERRVPVADIPIADTVYNSREGERFQSATVVDGAHPSVARANKWEGVKFYRAVKVNPANSRVLVKLGDDAPLLFERQMGQGRVLVFTSTFDNVSNDFPLSPAFVPFVEQTAHYLTGGEPRPANLPVDSHLELRSNNRKATAVEVIDPTGARPLSLKEAATASTLRLERAGFYDIRRGSGAGEVVAVNVDRAESDLAPVAAETRALWTGTPRDQAPGTGTDGTTSAETNRRTSNLWWYVMLVALLVAVAESFLAGGYLAKLRDEQPLERKEAA